MVHVSRLSPTCNPLAVAVAACISEKVTPAGPVQVPCAGATARLPANVTEVVGVQMAWSGPALAACAVPLKMLMVTSSNEVPFAHGPLYTVQRNTLLPKASPFTCEVGLPGFTMLPVPLIKGHVPVAGGMSALPLNVVAVIDCAEFLVRSSVGHSSRHHTP